MIRMRRIGSAAFLSAAAASLLGAAPLPSARADRPCSRRRPGRPISTIRPVGGAIARARTGFIPMAPAAASPGGRTGPSSISTIRMRRHMRAGLAALSQVRRNGSVPLAVARPRLGRLQVGPMQGGGSSDRQQLAGRVPCARYREGRLCRRRAGGLLWRHE